MSTEEDGIRAVRSAASTGYGLRSPTFDRLRSGSELERYDQGMAMRHVKGLDEKQVLNFVTELRGTFPK